MNGVIRWGRRARYVVLAHITEVEFKDHDVVAITQSDGRHMEVQDPDTCDALANHFGVARPRA